MTTEQRLERLERENRWMRRIGMLAAAVAAAVFLIGQGNDKEPQDLVVRSLKVGGGIFLDTAWDGRPMLLLKDRHGKVRAALGTDAHGTALRLADKHGRTRVTLGVNPAGAPSLQLYYEDGKKTRAALGLFADGTPNLRFLDADGKPRAFLAARTASTRRHEGTSLSLMDKNGNTRISLAVAPDGSPALGFGDDGVLQAMLALGLDGSLNIVDGKGKVIWKAPKD